MKPISFFLLGIILLLQSCGQGATNLPPVMYDKDYSMVNFLEDSLLKESVNEEDTVVNDSIADRLNPIRANFKRLNSITHWTGTTRKDLWETTEGGEARFYQMNGKLQKVVAHYLGENFHSLTEYYLLNDELSFVFEKELRYNRPYYWDSAAMVENADTEAFDIGRSEVIETRSYFEGGKLIHQLGPESGTPKDKSYLQTEESRIQEAFNKLTVSPDPNH